VSFNVFNILYDLCKSKSNMYDVLLVLYLFDFSFDAPRKQT